MDVFQIIQDGKCGAPYRIRRTFAPYLVHQIFGRKQDNVQSFYISDEEINCRAFSYPYPQALLIPDNIWLCCHIGVSLLCSFPVPSTRLYHTSGRKLFIKPTEISWQILCNLSLFPQKNWYERLLVLSYQLSISYLTEYTFFSILCVSCTYLWQKSDYRHAIHSYAT